MIPGENGGLTQGFYIQNAAENPWFAWDNDPEKTGFQNRGLPEESDWMDMGCSYGIFVFSRVRTELLDVRISIGRCL